MNNQIYHQDAPSLVDVGHSHKTLANLWIILVHIYDTDRSSKGCFSCRGMLDFDEEYKFDVVSH